MEMKGRTDLLQTLKRGFNVEGTAYTHTIRWAPQATTRIILQRIVRSNKTTSWGGLSATLAGVRGDYWELWEVIDGYVHPAASNEPVDRRHYYYAAGTLARADAQAYTRFHVPADPTARDPFITFEAPGYAVLPPGTPEEQAQGLHDNFSAGFEGTGSGRFKIYGEVYELTLEECRQNRVWLNTFRPNHRGDGKHTAGVLPAKFGADLTLPLQAPTLIRYEAGTYSQGPKAAANRKFPSKSAFVRFPPVGAREFNTIRP